MYPRRAGKPHPRGAESPGGAPGGPSTPPCVLGDCCAAP